MPDVERQSLTDLTARTATADSDLLHINSGGTDYKELKSDFTKNLAKWVDFGNSSALTAQIDALAGDCAYEGIILSYGHQTETGVPINANFYVDVIKIASGAGRVKIYALNSSAKPVSYINFKSGGSWQGWVQDPSRDEITSINSSLTNSTVSINAGSSSVTITRNNSYKWGNIIFVAVRFQVTSALAIYDYVFQIPSTYRIVTDVYVPLMGSYFTTVSDKGLYVDAGAYTIRASTAIPIGNYTAYIPLLVMNA